MIARSLIFMLIGCYFPFRSMSQVIDDSILINGVFRTFHFSKPIASAKKFYPVFILHGAGFNGKVMMRFTVNLAKTAEKEQILLVYPDSYKAWNNGRRPPIAGDINEESFFDSMLVYFNRRYETNKELAFAIGISAGGVMAYKLAMTMPEKFKAISAVVANLPDTVYCEQKRQPVAVMITNGTKDKINPYEGGEMIMNGKVAGYAKSTIYTFSYWADIAGYKGHPAIKEITGTDSSHQRITQYTYRKKHKPEMTLLKVHDMGHDNPKAVDIFMESVAFFKREIRRKK